MDIKGTNEKTTLSQWYKQFQNEVGSPKDNETSEEFSQRVISWWYANYSPELFAKIDREIENFQKNLSTKERKYFRDMNNRKRRIDGKEPIIVPEDQNAIADFYTQYRTYELTKSFVFLKDYAIATGAKRTWGLTLKDLFTNKYFKFSFFYILGICTLLLILFLIFHH